MPSARDPHNGGAALAKPLMWLVLLAASTAVVGASCDCEAQCAQLVTNLRQTITELQSEVATLRSGSGKVVAAPARRTALPEQFACGTDWRLESDLDVSSVGGCRIVRALEIGADITSLAGLRDLDAAESVLIKGNLYLTSLVGLDSLTHVEGDLIIAANDQLQSLDGLEGLMGVGANLIVDDNPNLESLAGLGSVTSVGADLKVSDNARLESLVGLHSLARVGETLLLSGNTILRSFTGLQSLQSADYASVAYNSNLASLEGLESLTHLPGGIRIGYCPNLTSLSGLDNLVQARQIMISQNERLPWLLGLGNLQTLTMLIIQENPGLQSLAGLENLENVTGRFHLEDNLQLSDISALQSLRTAGEFELHGTETLETLAGLDNLERVYGELKIYQHENLASVANLKSLTRVGALTIGHVNNLQSLAGLENLANAGDGISIEWTGLRSLNGLTLHRCSNLLIDYYPHARMEYLGWPFADGASINIVRIDERVWPTCVTPHELFALVSAVSALEESSFHHSVTLGTATAVPSTWPCKPEVFGTILCTKGQPCSFSLAGEERISIPGRFTGCGICLENQMQGHVTGDGVVDLGYALKDEEGGLRSICRCGSTGGPVAQLLLRGPRQSGVTVCSRGHNCSVTVDGEALERTDRILLMNNCSEGDPRLGISADWTAVNTYLLHDPATWYAALPTRYQLCWRAPCTSAADGPACPAPEDSYFHIGEVEVLGVFPQDYTLELGASLTVANIGFGVSDGDLMRLRRVCGQANYPGHGGPEAVSSGMWFSFGNLAEVEAGRYHLCWCQQHDSVRCDAESHFMADSGTVNIHCPAGQELVDSRRCVGCPAGRHRGLPGVEPCSECPAGHFSLGGETCDPCEDGAYAELPGSSFCAACPRWMSSNDDATACTPDPPRIFLLVVFLIAVGTFCAIIVLTMRRKLTVVDVSLEDGTIITTFGPHGFSNFGRSSFPATLRNTGHPGLDAPPEPRRVRVKDAVHLELLTCEGDCIKSRLDTSMGTLAVAFPHDLCHQRWPERWPVPIIISLPVLFTTVVVLGALVLESGMVTEALLGMGGVAAVSAGTSALVRCWPRSTPLAQRLRKFSQKVTKRVPNPKSCPKGPDRALAVGKLHELSNFFRDFIRDRTAYYMDTNILRPLTKTTKLSYAEFVGPGRVEWFVSHFWGTAFEHFCTALQKHAEIVCGERDWADLNYWVCFCSNNQHRIVQELGEGWEESSFYLTLKSGCCEGTCMVLDDKALPLTRIWCIFELLQTVKLKNNSPKFQGLLLCTSSGVLNTGNGSVDVAVALAKKVAAMDVQKAEASSAKDAMMIQKQVVQEMGSFDALNHFVSQEVREMLVQAQRNSNQQFNTVLTLLDQNITQTAAAASSTASLASV